MIGALTFLLMVFPFLSWGALSKHECLAVYKDGKSTLTDIKVNSKKSPFMLWPENGTAKNVIFSLANLHPLVVKSQFEIIKGMLQTTASNIIVLYSEGLSLKGLKDETFKLLGTLKAAEKARLYFVPTTMTDLAWARDFAPAAVSSGSDSRLVSFRYAKDELLGKRTAEELAKLFNLPPPIYPDLFADGGAYLIDHEGRLFISEIVKIRNKASALKIMLKNQGQGSFILDPARPLVAKTDKDIENILKQALGAKEVIWVKALPPELESTGHVDMYAKIVSSNQVIVAQSRNPDVARTLNQIADLFKEYGFQVIRLQTALQNKFGFRSYTNSTIVENTVFLPQYKDARADKAAVEAYIKLGFKVKTNDGSSIECGGSTHCLSGIEPNSEIVPRKMIEN